MRSLNARDLVITVVANFVTFVYQLNDKSQ